MAQLSTAVSDGDPAYVGAANTFTAANSFSGGTNSATPLTLATLINSTAAIAGTQSASPAIIQTGQGWKTTATAASQSVSFKQFVLPVQGTTAPTGIWKLQSDINGGGYSDMAAINSAGLLTLGGASDAAGLTGLQGPNGMYIGAGTGAVTGGNINTIYFRDSAADRIRSSTFGVQFTGSIYATISSFFGPGGITPNGNFHVCRTSEQMRIGYDGSNYYTTTVGSTGSVTFALTGTSPTFTFSQAATFSSTLAVTGATTLTGNLTSNGALISTPQALSGAGAVNVTTLTTAVTTTAPAQALTLANGTNGQIKTIVHQALSGGGTWVLTPTTKTGYTTITSGAVGDTCTLQFFTTIGWCILSLRGAIAA
jgi:hypothetical protein